MLLNTRLYAAYLADTARYGTNSTFGRAVVELVIGRLRWATKQHNAQGAKLLWKEKAGWKWDLIASNNYTVLFEWFAKGMNNTNS